MINILFILCASVTISNCASLPKNIKKCSLSDPKLNDCLSSSFGEAINLMKNGLSELRMPPLQPLLVGSMKIARGSGPVGFDQIYDDAKIFNIPNFTYLKVTDVNYKDPDKLHCYFDAHYNNITFASNFTGNGNILSIPIKVNGPFIVELKDTFAKFEITYIFIEKKGKRHLQVKEFKTDLNPKMIHYDLKNNAPDEFKIDINAILNDNALDVFTDVKPGYDQAIGLILKNTCNQFFVKVPYEELFLP